MSESEEPVIELGDISFDKDPEPVAQPKAPRNRRTPKAAENETKPDVSTPRSVGRPTNEAIRTEAQEQLAEEVEGFMLLIGMGLMMRDQHEDGTSCAQLYMEFDPVKKEIVATQEVKNFSAAMAVVGVDNRYIRAFFGSADGANKYLTLAMATLPFFKGMTEVHGMPSRRKREFDGDIEGLS